MNDESEKPRPWFFVSPDQEVLQGNRHGLENLRDAINGALNTGEGRVTSTIDDLTTVQCLESDPRKSAPESKATFQKRLGCFLGAVMALAVLGLASLGLVFLWQHIHP